MRAPLRTLIVAPVSLLEQWRSEILFFAKTRLKIDVHHGSGKSKDPNFLALQDIVLTTYGTVSKEAPEPSPPVARPNGGGPLFRVKWFRVILDEASWIKNRTSAVSQAVYKLRAGSRWCLSGTPIQNSMEDAFAYFRFLRFSPYQEYKVFCESFMGGDTRSILRLNVALKSITLRRTKTAELNGRPVLELPPLQNDLILVKFSSEERDHYKALEYGRPQLFGCPCF